MAATLRKQVDVYLGQAGLRVGSLVYARQGRREHCPRRTGRLLAHPHPARQNPAPALPPPVIELTQVNGGFYCNAGITLVVRHSVARLTMT